MKLECPFDLETVFTMQYSTEGLKGVLTWIIDNLGDCKQGLAALDAKVNDKLKQVDLNKDGVAQNAAEIELLKKISNELDVRGNADVEKLGDLNVTVENLNMNVSM